MRWRAAGLAWSLMWMLEAPAGLGQAQPFPGQSWRDLSPRERYDAMQNYWQHEQLPQDRQQDIQKHYERWQGMSPEERAKIRQNYERFRQLPPGERERIQRKYEKWKHQGEPPG